MFRFIIILALSLCLFVACQKEASEGAAPESLKSIDTVPSTKEYKTYTIAAGEQFCDINFYEPVHYQEIKFLVRFDSSCIYKTADPNNQLDINKLYGFSDNNAHHHNYSARFGWRWSNDSLRLFAYVYNASIRESIELGTIAIGAEQSCVIKVMQGSYQFSLNGKVLTMKRSSSTPNAEGYKLYPYFGGDEPAPHKITIHIREEL